jgi:hypothetical protein
MKYVLKHNNKIMNSKSGLKALLLHGILQVFCVCPQGCYLVSISGEHMSVNKWAQANLFKNILLTSIKYYLTHKTEYVMTWKDILPHVMDEWYFWMINQMDELSNEH